MRWGVARVGLAAALLSTLSFGGAGSSALAANSETSPTKPFPSVPFVVGCAVSHEADADPILHPKMNGKSHRHVFFGNRSTSADSTLSTLRKSATTCEDPLDRASYWMPGLIGKATWTNMRAYYLAGGVASGSVKPFPFGLQMIAGWTFDAENGPRSVTWSCGLLADQDGWSASKPKTCRTGTNIAVRIDFPQCWTGSELNHGRSGVNVARPVDGSCPRGFPVAMPLLRIRAEIRGEASALSSGGFETMHADFWNVWEPKRLEQLVATCIRGERTVQREVRRCGVPGAGPRKG